MKYILSFERIDIFMRNSIVQVQYIVVLTELFKKLWILVDVAVDNSNKFGSIVHTHQGNLQILAFLSVQSDQRVDLEQGKRCGQETDLPVIIFGEIEWNDSDQVVVTLGGYF